MPFKIKIMGGYYKCMKYLWRQTRALGPVWGPAGCVGRTCWGRRSSRWARSAVLWSVFGPWCRSSGRTCRGSGCTGSAASSAAREDVKRLGEKSRMRCYRRDNAERRAFGSKDWFCEGCSWNWITSRKKNFKRNISTFIWYTYFCLYWQKIITSMELKTWLLFAKTYSRYSTFISRGCWIYELI